MLERFMATILGVALGYILYRTFLTGLQQTIQVRFGAWEEKRKRRREVRKNTRYRLLDD